MSRQPNGPRQSSFFDEQFNLPGAHPQVVGKLGFRQTQMLQACIMVGPGRNMSWLIELLRLALHEFTPFEFRVAAPHLPMSPCAIENNSLVELTRLGPQDTIDPQSIQGPQGPFSLNPAT